MGLQWWDVGGCPRFCFVRVHFGRGQLERSRADEYSETQSKLLSRPCSVDLGIELVDVESHPGHVKVTIDRSRASTSGPSAEATAAVSHALDEADRRPWRALRARGHEPRGGAAASQARSTSSRFVGTEHRGTACVPASPATASGGSKAGWRRPTTPASSSNCLVAAVSGACPTAMSSAPTPCSTGGRRWRAPRHRSARSVATRSRRPPTAAGRQLRRARQRRSPPSLPPLSRPASSPSPSSGATSGQAHRKQTKTDADRHVTETP